MKLELKIVMCVFFLLVDGVKAFADKIYQIGAMNDM
jgi:hypothetical protein